MSTFLRQDSSIPSTRNELGTQAHVAGQMLRRPSPAKSDWLYLGLGGLVSEWPLTQEVGRGGGDGLSLSAKAAV